MKSKVIILTKILAGRWQRRLDEMGHRNGDRRAVITGIGVISPIGIGIHSYWKNLMAGKCGIKKISQFNPDTFPCQIAGEVEWQPERYLNKRGIKHYSRATQFAVTAARLAFQDSGLEGLDPVDTAVITGTGAPAVEQIENQILDNDVDLGRFEADKRQDPTSLIKGMISAPASAIALSLGTHGHVETVSATCASAFSALGRALERIKAGREDVIIAGGVDAPITRIYMQALCASKAIAFDYNDRPREALRPFEKNRTRSVLAEGAGIFVCESAGHARARGARIYCDIESFSMGSENTNELFLLEREGRRWSDVIRRAVGRAPIDLICAHGPGDKTIDRVEISALNASLGRRARRIPVTSTKGATGSSFSAAGALQLAAAAMTLHTGRIPPTRNYEVPDPECNLNIISKPIRKRPRSVLVNVHGLGGINAAIVLKRAH